VSFASLGKENNPVRHWRSSNSNWESSQEIALSWKSREKRMSRKLHNQQWRHKIKKHPEGDFFSKSSNVNDKL